MSAQKTFYLLGGNIRNSLSPQIHNIIYGETGLKAQYLLKESSFLPDLRQISADGFNITAPFKTKILTQLDQNFSLCKSVNTVKKTKSLLGYSTDGYGFLLDAKRLGLNLSSVLILGTGGAARAVACALNCPDLYVWGRDKVRENSFASSLSAAAFNKNDKNFIKLIINCTGAALPQFNFAPVYDLNYKAPYGISGIGMLIYQAILSDEIFFDTKIDLKIFNTILAQLKKKNFIAN